MDEKISKLFLPLLEKLFNSEPAGEPFRYPVDVVKYGCRNYYDFIKHPIDLSTIRKRLLSHQYKDAWRFVADIQLMFTNAYSFNKRGTPVYDYTNRLSKIWNNDSPLIMQRLNYCCGSLYKFGPQLLFCHGTTPTKYCQILVGMKYKCYQDQYSFCVPCFNKIEGDFVEIRDLSCETPRTKLPTHPVKKSDFIDCTNDNWQYERFIQCTHCYKRLHLICELYPADENEIESCLQHEQIEEEQRLLCTVPEEYRNQPDPTNSVRKSQTTSPVDAKENRTHAPNDHRRISNEGEKDKSKEQNPINVPIQSEKLDEDIYAMALDIEMKDPNYSDSEDSESINHDDTFKSDSTKEDSNRKLSNYNNCNIETATSPSISNSRNSASSCIISSSSSKFSVDNIAARLSINKLSAEAHPDDQNRSNTKLPQQSRNHHKDPSNSESVNKVRDKYVCNTCYKRQKIGLNLRHRKFSARRLPHTRLSRYIEIKVNEYIREYSPSAGEVTIRVLTAYRDKITVNRDLQDYLKKSREKDPNQYPNLEYYPKEFGYTNRAIFAWQEIDGVDVCVFGMHVQEYGEDCPEPNRHVVYLSYLDSVHFFRPKQFRTAVYQEILLSYFKYVKKLGYRRVFIWVCPARKGDDYIFYRHPSEQKMPNNKRLSDWYAHLLDKGVMSGIVEKHQNIYQYADTQNWTSILDMPYLSGDYWPGEFERLLKIMIESQEKYDIRMAQDNDGIDIKRSDTSDLSQIGRAIQSSLAHELVNQHNFSPLNTVYQHKPPTLDSKDVKLKMSALSSLGLSPTLSFNGLSGREDSNLSRINSQWVEQNSAYDEPLDLSKTSSVNSPSSMMNENDDVDDDDVNDYPLRAPPSKKKRRKSYSMGYIKKRTKSSQGGVRASQANSSYHESQSSKSSKNRSMNQSQKEPIGFEELLHPEEELMRNFKNSLKRQKDGFIVARLSECDCSPLIGSQRQKEEAYFRCDLMKGREPFLQLARLNNYEFSTLRRAKFSSLAMVKHLGEYLDLDPICNECFSFDSSKRHFKCSRCDDFFLCTSCHENTQHEHTMSLMDPILPPDVTYFMRECTSSAISSASSTTSNKSLFDSNIDTSPQLATPNSLNASVIDEVLSCQPSNSSNSIVMPLSCQRQMNLDLVNSQTRREDEENADLCLFDERVPEKTKINSSNPVSNPSGHSSDIALNSFSNINLELDNVVIDNFVRQAEITYDVDFDQLKNESKKLLTHYWGCPLKDSCPRCKFIILSCSFMSILMRSSRVQGTVTRNPSGMPNGNNNIYTGGINLTAAHQTNYQFKDK